MIRAVAAPVPQPSMSPAASRTGADAEDRAGRSTRRNRPASRSTNDPTKAGAALRFDRIIRSSVERLSLFRRNAQLLLFAEDRGICEPEVAPWGRFCRPHAG